MFLAFVLLTAFLSLGYYWGNDVAKYEERFEYYSNSGIALFDFSQYGFIALKEFGFVFINLLCKPIGFWGMRAVLFILENAILYYFIVKHVDRKWYWLAVFIYVFNPNFWVLSSSMMRQWLAICIVVLATDFLSRNKENCFCTIGFAGFNCAYYCFDMPWLPSFVCHSKKTIQEYLWPFLNCFIIILFTLTDFY